MDFSSRRKIMVDFVEICRQETDIAFPPLEPELTQSFDHNEDIRSIYGMFLQPLVPNTVSPTTSEKNQQKRPV